MSRRTQARMTNGLLSLTVLSWAGWFVLADSLDLEGLSGLVFLSVVVVSVLAFLRTLLMDLSDPRGAERQRRVRRLPRFWAAMIVLIFGTNILGNLTDAWWWRLVGVVVLASVFTLLARPLLREQLSSRAEETGD